MFLTTKSADIAVLPINQRGPLLGIYAPGALPFFLSRACIVGMLFPSSVLSEMLLLSIQPRPSINAVLLLQFLEGFLPLRYVCVCFHHLLGLVVED